MEKFLRCACGDEFPTDSYGAGFLDAKGKCFGCDAEEEAAPVVLPEPVAFKIYDKCLPEIGFWISDERGGHWQTTEPLYTEKQVRELLKRQ